MNNKKGTEIKRLTSQPPARPLKDEEEKAYREGEGEQKEEDGIGEEDKEEDDDGEEGELKKNQK